MLGSGLAFGLSLIDFSFPLLVARCVHKYMQLACHKPCCRTYVLLISFALPLFTSAAAQSLNIVPLPNAHAHNDYEHARPLLDALDHGFTSVEADVYTIRGVLLVGHDREALTPERTLEKLYLVPLAERVQENHGHVYARPSRFF